MTAAATVTAALLQHLSHALAESCVRVPVAQGPAGIARELARIAPELSFRLVLSRGGWYRLGGVVDFRGRHLADDLEGWTQAELAKHDDLATVAAVHAGQGLRATRLNGRAHYWMARKGDGPADFIQIEIEELQELACHPLFPDGTQRPPAEDLIDPHEACSGAADVLGVPFYALRRVTDLGAFLDAMRAQEAEPQPIHRLVADWTRSSASRATDLGNHWVIAVREHLGRYRQQIKGATPVAAFIGVAPRFDGSYGARGLALARALQRFDRQVGYPLAWFFHMLTTKRVPYAVADVVMQDVHSGFGYLPERDVQVVRDWLHRPYAF